MRALSWAVPTSNLGWSSADGATARARRPSLEALQGALGVTQHQDGEGCWAGLHAGVLGKPQFPHLSTQGR